MGRIKKESIYKNWYDVDRALKKLGSLEIEKSRIEGEQTLAINKIKEGYTARGEEIVAEQKRIKTEITRFCEENKDAFLSKRSKKLNFGTIGYRVSESVKYDNENLVIKMLKSLNFDFCLKITEKVEKDKLKELDSTTLTKLGVQIVKKDGISIEPDIAQIAANVQE